MLVLLPPSEGKAPGGRGRWSPDSGAFPELGPARREVVEAAASALADRRRLFGTDGPLADRAEEALRALVAGTAPSLPAWKRFTGVVWEHLEPASLPASARRRIVVPSAQLGLTRGEDPTPDFRLRFAVSLPGLGRLDRWWRPQLAAVLARTRGPVVDLLPGEHAAAVQLPRTRRVVRVDFVAAGGAGAAGHAAKAVKGVLARTILLDGLDAVAELDWQGWRAEPADGGFVVRAPG